MPSLDSRVNEISSQFKLGPGVIIYIYDRYWQFVEETVADMLYKNSQACEVNISFLTDTVVGSEYPSIDKPMESKDRFV